MCVIITAQEGRVIPVEHLREANRINSDGWGIAVRHKVGDSPVIERGFTTPSLVAAYEAMMAAKTEDTVSVVHCRITTHGQTNIANTHPFEIGDDMWLFHNGTFRIKETNKDMSDTWHFAQGVKSLLDEFPGEQREHAVGTQLFRSAMDWAFGHVFSTWSKGTILTPNHVLIVEESEGKWKEGIWYSNSSAFPVVRRRGSEDELIAMGDGTYRVAPRHGVTYPRAKGKRGRRGNRVDVAQYGAPYYSRKTGETFIGDSYTCPTPGCNTSYLYSQYTYCPECLVDHPEWLAFRERFPNLATGGTITEQEAFMFEADRQAQEDAAAWRCKGTLCDGECTNERCEVKAAIAIANTMLEETETQTTHAE